MAAGDGVNVLSELGGGGVVLAVLYLVKEALDRRARRRRAVKVLEREMRARELIGASFYSDHHPFLAVGRAGRPETYEQLELFPRHIDPMLDKRRTRR